MNKQYRIGAICVALLSCLICYFSLRNVSFADLENYLQSINYLYLLLAFAMILLGYLCECLILKMLITEDHPFWNYLRIPAIQSVFNAITPFATGGQPSQLIALNQTKVEFGKASSALLVKFMIFQVITFISYFLTFIFNFEKVINGHQHFALVILLGFLINLAGIAFLVAALFAKNFIKKVVMWLVNNFKFVNLKPWETKIVEKVDNFYHQSQIIKADPAKFIKITGLTALQLISTYVIPFFILKSMGVNASLFNVMGTTLLVSLFMSVIPIPGASIGAEYSFATLFATFTSSQSKLMVIMLIWRMVTYYFGILLGTIAWWIPCKKTEEK